MSRQSSYNLDADTVGRTVRAVRSAATECPFCGLDLDVAGFRSNAGFVALYNVAPVLPGHSLVLPRYHVESLLALPDADLAGLFAFARGVTRLVMRAFNADGFDWTIQDGASAGQTVPHLHLHVIPRHMGDLPEPGDWYPALAASENIQIDDGGRPRLTPAEHARVTAHLRALADDAGSNAHVR